MLWSKVLTTAASLQKWSHDCSLWSTGSIVRRLIERRLLTSTSTQTKMCRNWCRQTLLCDLHIHTCPQAHIHFTQFLDFTPRVYFSPESTELVIPTGFSTAPTSEQTSPTSTTPQVTTDRDMACKICWPKINVVASTTIKKPYSTYEAFEADTVPLRG